MFTIILTFLPILLHISKAASVERCRGGQNMTLKTDGYAWGDPHIQMFNTYWQHFQGQANHFYYYMKPLSKRQDLSNASVIINTGITVDTTGFNLIVAHAYYTTKRNVFKWYMIELFDNNNIYQIYVQQTSISQVGYITRTRNSRTVQDITAVTLTPINTGITSFGSRFKIEYTLSGRRMQVTVIDQHCIDLGGTGISLDTKYTAYKYHSGYWGRLHAKTECYQCQITGYFGDYYNNGNTAYNCQTGVPTSGLSSLFTDDKLSCEVPNEEIIPPAPSPPTNDWCADTTIEDKVKAACTTAFNTHTTNPNCCATNLVNDCNDEQISCWTDTCATIGNEQTTTPTDQQIQDAANAEMLDALSSMPECVPPPPPNDAPPLRQYCAGGTNEKFSHAQMYCAGLNSVLAIINTEAEFEIASNACKAAGEDQYCWIGYTRDSTSDTTFEWLDGSLNPGNAINWGNWAPNEPTSVNIQTGEIDGSFSREYCVLIDPTLGRKWTDVRCGNGGNAMKARPLCVKKGDVSCNTAAIKIENKLNNDNINNNINVETKNDFKFLTFGIGIGVIITLFIVMFIRLFGNNNKIKYQKINVVSDASSDAASSDDDNKV